MAADFSSAQQQQQMLQQPSGPIHHAAGPLQQPLLSQQYQQQQWLGPQQQYRLVPAGDMGGPQAVPYPAGSMVVHTSTTQAYAAQFSCSSAASSGCYSSSADPTAWAPMQQAPGVLTVPAPLGPQLYAPQPLYLPTPGVLSAPLGVRVQQQA
jgi:hypothetical protein